MSIINLNRRVTSDWDARCENLKSPDSLVLVKPKVSDPIQNPASMEVEVGDNYILPDDNKTYKIDDNGLKVKPGCSVVVYSRQKFALPYNVFGVVTGKGNYIFQGCFVSTGKIDPGFNGFLKIGFYNGGRRNIVLKPGTAFASVFFISTEFTMAHKLEDYQSEPPADCKPIGFWRRFGLFVSAHWKGALGWLIAVPASIYYVIQLVKIITGS